MKHSHAVETIRRWCRRIRFSDRSHLSHAIVMQYAWSRRPCYAGDGAQVFVNGSHLMHRHALKRRPRHDLKKIAIERRGIAPAIRNAIRRFGGQATLGPFIVCSPVLSVTTSSEGSMAHWLAQVRPQDLLEIRSRPPMPRDRCRLGSRRYPAAPDRSAPIVPEWRAAFRASQRGRLAVA